MKRKLTDLISTAYHNALPAASSQVLLIMERSNCYITPRVALVLSKTVAVFVVVLEYCSTKTGPRWEPVGAVSKTSGPGCLGVCLGGPEREHPPENDHLKVIKQNTDSVNFSDAPIAQVE